MVRDIVQAEPNSTRSENRNAPAPAVTRHGDTIDASGVAPFDPGTGALAAGAPIARRAELVLEQISLRLETAGSSLAHVLTRTVHCTSVEPFTECDSRPRLPSPPFGTDVRERPGVARSVRHRG